MGVFSPLIDALINALIDALTNTLTNALTAVYPTTYQTNEVNMKTQRSQSLEALLQHRLLWRGRESWALHSKSGYCESRHCKSEYLKSEHLKSEQNQSSLTQPGCSQASSNHAASIHAATVETGYSQLDQKLHLGGWPTRQLVECLQADHTGPGIHLFMPALNTLQQRQLTESQYLYNQHPVLLINPPCIPYLAGWSLDNTPLWIAHTDSISETIWLTERSLKSNSCLAIFAWLESQLPQKILLNQANDKKKQRHTRRHAQLNAQLSTQLNTQLRKLQLAATKNRGLSVLFRQHSVARQPSPATLRLTIDLTADQNSQHKRSSINVHILKQPGGWGGQHCSIPWYAQLQQVKLPSHQWPVHKPLLQNDHYQKTHDDQLLVGRQAHRQS